MVANTTDGATTTTSMVAGSLTPADRCDRCGAQAFVRVVLQSGDLLFCGHHYARYESALKPAARAVQDHTHRLRDGSPA